ncbi:RNase H domain-containing protein [Trichonephila clavipes]|uniref:RNase H domain-containing protein n=1 Tax=Trichonephila clavipes TaxID=2585209 RepID=A0A8X6UY12_TRICX|nr:RNase H domain-containing protein [Trichonephila clavipes]
MSSQRVNNIFDWSELNKFEFNPFKTKVMKIYKKSTVDQRINLKLGGVIIEVHKIKYLGIIVNNKMQWKEHISYVSSNSEKILLILLRISNNTFGVKTDVLQLIYKQGIVPLISYASRAWGHSLSKKINSRLIRRTQRRFLLHVIKGYKTISYEVVFAIFSIPPIDLVILNNLDVRENHLSTSLSTLEGTIPDSLLPHPSCWKPITLVTYINEVFQEYKTVCFTDGRKLNGRVGLVCVIYEEGVENFTFQHRLTDECSVFQVELLCINLVEKLIQASLRQGGTLNFLVCTDSLSTLHCLISVNSTEKLVVEVQSTLVCKN